jgi:DNA-binding MarR family transcriptional regulator
VSQRARGPTPPTADLRLVQEVAGLVTAMAARLQANFAAIAAEAGLTATQAKLLMRLQPSEALPMRVLADQLAYDPSNLTGVVDKLEQRGAVRRRPDPDDRRVKGLVITAEGVRLRDAFWHRLVGDPGPLGHLNRAQLTRLREALAEALGPPGDS